MKYVMCSIGCPYSCAYCANDGYKKLYGRSTLQLRPVDEVMSEIEELREYPLEFIFMQDDVFPLYNPDWLVEFCDAYEAIKVPFHIQLRIEMLAEPALERLKSVGLHSVTFAIESGNEQLRRDVLKRYMTDDTIISGAELLHKYDIKFRTENMLGIPAETWDTVMETIKLNRRCKPTLAWASLYQPYPGTELGDKCIKDGTFDGNINEIEACFFDRYVLDVPDAKRYERLQRLFSFAVRYLIVEKLLWLLTRLPLNRIYYRIYRKYKQFIHDTKLYNAGAR